MDDSSIGKNKNTETEPEKLDEGEQIEIEIDKDSVKESASMDTKASMLADKFAEMQEAIAEKDDKYLRIVAEFDNYKKRTSREFGNLIETANQDLIKNLLDILDNFKRALDIDKSCADLESFYKGIELTYNQLDTLLKEKGLEEIQTEGQPFDPEIHEAVMTTQTNDVPEDQIVEELQKGYKLKGRVIRHSKVSVAKPNNQEKSNLEE
jgi:molecular chaperone GrpE